MAKKKVESLTVLRVDPLTAFGEDLQGEMNAIFCEAASEKADHAQLRSRLRAVDKKLKQYRLALRRGEDTVRNQTKSFSN